MNRLPAVRTALCIALLALLAGCAATDAAAATRSARKPVRRATKKVAQPTPATPVMAQSEPAAVADPAPAPELPPPPPRDPWQEARDLADRGQPDSAVVVLREFIAADPLDFGLRWLEAGILGESGRHRESLVIYERLAAEFPERAPELLADRASERLATGDARGAAADLEAWIAAHPGDVDARRNLGRARVAADDLPGAMQALEEVLLRQPADTGAALDRAQVLGWMGRHREAIAAYGTLLASEPGLVAAERGLAQNENWSGDHRRAARRLEALVARDPADAESWKLLAHARYWDDDPDGAATALARQRALAPEDREALALSERIAREQRARIELGHGRSNDSDGLGVGSPALELSWPLAARTTGSVTWRHDVASDDGGSANATQWAAGVRRNFGPLWTAYARGASISWDPGPGAIGGGELGAIMRPTPRTRLEWVTSREPVLTRLAMVERVSLLQWAFAADWDVTSRLLLSAVARSGSYSDGNRSRRHSLAARWQFRDDARWEFAGRLEWESLAMDRDLDHGYYDPAGYHEWGPAVTFAHRPDATWRLSMSLRSGWQREQGASTEPYYGIEGGSEWSPGPDWSLAATAGSGDSNLLNASGYLRGWWRLTLARAF